jgi:hypothetical protein
MMFSRGVILQSSRSEIILVCSFAAHAFDVASVAPSPVDT